MPADPDDALLDTLADRARARADTRWDERPPGPLSPEERHALGRDDLDEGFAPPSLDALAAATAAATAALAAPEPAPAPVVSLDPARPRRRGWGPWVAGLALAAGLLLVVRAPAPPTTAAYHLEPVGGVATTRGDADALGLEPGASFRLRARPASSVTASVEVAVALQAPGFVLPLPVDVRRSPQGALDLEGHVAEGVSLPAEGQIVVHLLVGGERQELTWPFVSVVR